MKKFLISLERFLNCVNHLGWRMGLRYWKIQNDCIKRPALALEWAVKCEETAKKHHIKGEKEIAEAYDGWAVLLRESYNGYMMQLWKVCNEKNV